jgi:hypothetical protein
VFSFLGIDHNAEDFVRENKYAERFFSLLGAKEIISLDYSAYEDASVIHDMNFPIPNDLREQFSMVHDGGTIEHVFNISQALKNCMEMVQIGGHFIQVNVANNYMGHGFWQFSPELLFRAFSPANGYQIDAILLHEVVPGGAWYVVTDPDKIHSRVELCNNFPTFILTVARRTARAEIFASPPLQSDYVDRWSRSAKQQPQPASTPGGGNTHPQAVKGPTGWRRYLPGTVKRAGKVILKRLSIIDSDKIANSGFNQSCYTRIDEYSLLRGKIT